ncbi:hypothetical protein ACFL1G_08315 [Planctomycetota bacterium]
MMDFLSLITTWVNVPMNALGKILLAPVAVLPGWLSNTIISAVVGVMLLLIFKYTSNQKAIALVRDSIKANMLALKLFKDSMLVTMKSQGLLFKAAFQLLFYALKPMLVMIVPVSLILAQMGLWYQYRPLRVGEKALITMQLNSKPDSPLPMVSIDALPSAEVRTGPVRISSEDQICWEIKAIENSKESVVFKVGSELIEKELIVGDGFERLSVERPAWNFSNILLHPKEKPFRPDSVVQSISIDYPERLSLTSGTDWWLVYFFIASMVFALIFKPFLKVRI